MAAVTASLNGLALPADQYRRQVPVPTAQLPEAFELRHDFNWLWYDAFWRDGRVYLVCPKLFNFASLLRRAEWRIDGAPARVARIQNLRRHDIVTLNAACKPVEIRLSLDGFKGGSAVSDCPFDLMAGLNAHVAISHNNDLQWIHDFALYHKREQGLQAMLLFDNASDRYGVDDIHAALAPVGLESVVVVPTPYPYGPRGALKYLQTSVLDIARLRFLRDARATLVCDIDELVVTEGPNVFDATARNWLGFSTFNGQWRFPAEKVTSGTCHADHIYQSASAERCNAKYCIVPNGPLRRLSWDVHKLDFISVDKLLRRKAIHFLHCSAVTTDWKGQERYELPDDLTIDPKAQSAFQRVFGRG